MKKSGVNILIVDDDESIRIILQDTLVNNNYNVESARNGKEAIEKVKEKFFNIAILDYRLPDMDGIELGKNIKELSNDTENIILTGWASLESAMEAVREDIYDYLTKPVDIDNLIKVIGNALEKQYLIIENRKLLWDLKKSRDDLVKAKDKEIELQAAAEKVRRKVLEEARVELEKKVEERTAELEKAYKDLSEKTQNLERFQKVTVGREMEMVKLKEEVNSLLEKTGQPKKYESPEKIKKIKGNSG